MIFSTKTSASKFLIIFLILFSTRLVAQNTTDSMSTTSTYTMPAEHKDTATAPYYYRLNGKYLGSLWTDFKGVVASPFHWKGSDWGKAAVIIGVGAGLQAWVDKPVKHMMQRNQKSSFTHVTKVVEPLGNQIGPALVTGLYLTGLISGNRRIEHAGLSVARSVLISTAIYTASKTIFRRQRPVRTDNPYLFAAPFTQTTFTSFPSGHSNTIFSIATALALEFKESKWVPWVTYTIATMTATARLYQNRHWTSDVWIGAAMGHFITKKVYAMEEKRRPALKPTY